MVRACLWLPSMPLILAHKGGIVQGKLVLVNEAFPERKRVVSVKTEYSFVISAYVVFAHMCKLPTANYLSGG